MTINLILKACGVWLVIMICAIVNGMFRENIVAPKLGQNIALPLSGLSLAMLIFIITYFVVPVFGKNNSQTYFLIGAQWVMMTLLFEFLFGYYVAGKSWEKLFQVFNILKGDLFILVLCTTLISPIVAAKLRGML